MATPIPQNQLAWTIEQIAKATNGVIVRPESMSSAIPLSGQGIVTDSRAVVPGTLFVALQGETHDAHKFLSDVKAKGATAAVVNRKIDVDIPYVQVQDTQKALGDLAQMHVAHTQSNAHIPSIGITGSAGKTTTRALCAAGARAIYTNVLSTEGNLNNLVGVPMMLFLLQHTHNAMVIECGTSARGEIKRLGEILQPDVGVVLNADIAHTEGIGTLADVAVEKGAMFAAAKIAVANADDRVSADKALGLGIPVLMFGRDTTADVRLKKRWLTQGGKQCLVLDIDKKLNQSGSNKELEVTLSMLGEGPAVDAAASICALAALQIPNVLTDEQYAKIVTALENVQPVAGRLSVLQHKDRLIVDDSYNANPRSMKASLQMAKELADARGGRLIAVLGDMLELGDVSVQAHRDVGIDVVANKASLFVGVGQQMGHAVRAAVGAKMSGIAVEVAKPEDAAVIVESVWQPHDVVLAKGSRGMKMEKVVHALVGGG